MFALTFAIALLVSSSSTQAAQFNVINTFNARDCTGAINSTFIQGPAGACEYTSETSSLKRTCGEQMYYLNSTTCQGEGINATTSGQCETISIESSQTRQAQCKDYSGSSIVEVTVSTSCNFTVSESNKLYLPLDVCVSAPSNPGGPYYSSNSDVSSYKIAKSGSAFTFTMYGTAACTGTSNSTEVASAGCTLAVMPAISSGTLAFRAKVYGSSAQNMVSSAMLLLVVVAASFW
ncbi:hypothetical protein BASA81_000524 [Batrachochytrium salamandrivorans]|nr:hypothetical protein BASA81_000524 [Batrachochytrium salamandrivorans]